MSNGDWWTKSWVIAPGCSKFGPECAHCWAEAMARRLQGMKKPGYEGLINERGLWSGKVQPLPDRLGMPYHWKKPQEVAVNLMGDLFHPTVPFEFIERAFVTMVDEDRHRYLVLTKRPERMVEFLQSSPHWKGKAEQQIWLGTTAGTQNSANTRWSAMAWLAEAGWSTWVSSEPRLEAIDWHGWSFLKRLVTGGESGPYARPMAPAWARSDRDWCTAHGVEFWFKQWGEWAPLDALRNVDVSATYVANLPVTSLGNENVYRIGRKLAGRLLDGKIHGELKVAE